MLGLWIRRGWRFADGGVFSQIHVFAKHPLQGSPVMPWGKGGFADRYGCGGGGAGRYRRRQELCVRRVRSLRHAVVNTGKTPTILTLMGRDDFEPEELARLIQGQCKPGQFFSFNVGDLCERLLDSKLYANIMMIGVAYQLGFIPLSYKSLTLGEFRHAVGRTV